MMTDLKEASEADYLVIGWFTPDYRPLAEKFAANLSQQGAPYHLFARLKQAEGWNTAQKPAVVLEAMALYPNKTLILMDVDCRVRGSLQPLARLAGDVGITVTVQNNPRKLHWLSFETSSRVVVFNPTVGARRFAEAWQKEIEKKTLDHDEYNMAWAFIRSADVVFSFIDRDYSGREITTLPAAVVVHESAHSKHRAKQRNWVQNALRGLERRFLRTGRTRARKTLVQLETV